MAFRKDDRNMDEFQVYVSKTQGQEIRRIAKKLNLPYGRLISYAIENELKEENPFEVDLTLPDNLVHDAYAQEAGKILGYMKKLRTGMSLDLLYIARHDFGVYEKDAFLGGFKQCLDTEVIEAYVQDASIIKIGGVTGDIVKYRAKTNNPVIRKKMMKKAKTKDQEFAEYQKLRKKFEGKA